MSFLLGTTLLAVVTALACALPGVFVVLRKSSMLVDAIGHAVLPGIVVGYLLTRDLSSPLLIVGAALSGLLVVLGAQLLQRSGLVAGDAPHGLVFPALFSVGVLLMSSAASNVHLDAHVVLVGDLNLAAFEQLLVHGVAVGPRYLVVMTAVLVLVVLGIALGYRVLEVTTFDAAFARSLGMRTGLVETAFMFGVSAVVTASFHAAGAILVLALVVIPAATARLLTDRLATMLALTGLIAVVGALAGFWIAYALDAATSAAMAVAYGVGLAAVAAVTSRRRRRARAHSGGAPTEGVAVIRWWRPRSHSWRRRPARSVVPPAGGG